MMDFDLSRPADSLHRSRDSSVLLRSGLNMIQQAISLYSEDLVLLVANRRFKTIFNLPDRLIEPGARFDDTIRHLAAQGEYGPVEDTDQFVADRVNQALTFQPHYLERKRANGRWLSIEGGPLRQGGWVAVYTDITDIKRQEHILRARSEDLSGELLSRSEELARTNRALQSTITQLRETQQHLEAAEARVRLAAETTPAHIARIDRQGRYTYSNHRLPLSPANGASDIVGHGIQEVLGTPIYTIISDAMNSALGGAPKVVEFDTPEGDNHIRAAFTPDTDMTGAVTGAYILSMEISPGYGDRASPTDPVPKTRASFNGWVVNLQGLEVTAPDGRTETLSLAEAALLRHFLERPNEVLTRDDLTSARTGSTRSLDVRMSRLRRKLAGDPENPSFIRTVYGAGYLFAANVTWG